MTINVIDIDDNCPEFNPKEYNVTIRENLPSNHIIVRVTATDKDSGDNKGLDYGIRSGNEAGTLVIHPVLGESNILCKLIVYCSLSGLLYRVTTVILQP